MNYFFNLVLDFIVWFTHLFMFLLDELFLDPDRYDVVLAPLSILFVLPVAISFLFWVIKVIKGLVK